MNKNELFKRIFFGYLIIYALLVQSQFYKATDYAFNKKSFTELAQWYLDKVTPPALALFLFHFVGCKYVFTVVADKCIIAAKYTDILREKRIALVSTHLFKFCCFVYVSLLGYFSMRELDWIPKEYLFASSSNSGHVTMKWLIWHHQRFEHDNLPLPVQHYFEMITAYHLHSVIWHLLFSHGAFNFYEMLLHHFVTLSLISFCFLTGHTGIGVLVTVIHDITDVPAYGIKLAVNQASTMISVITYTILVISWCYYRVYAFGYAVIYPLYLEEYKFRVTEKHGFHEQTVYVLLLSTLLMLHCFWIYLFLKLGARFAIKGVIHDSQETRRSEYSDPDTDDD